jgi:type I restriction enzyme S subunit
MSWPTVCLGEITSKIGSGATPRGGNKAYKEDGIPLVRSMNVHDSQFKPSGLAFIDEEQAALLSNVDLRQHDVLLNITGASVARCCRLPDQYIGGRVNQHVSIIRPQLSKVLPEYLEHLLIAPATKARLLGIAGGGATREAITKTAITEFRIPLPPREEQKRIAGILDQADALRRLRTRALEKLNTLGQAIFHEMFGATDGIETKLLSEVVYFQEGPGVRKWQFRDKGIKLVNVGNIVDGELNLGKTDRHLDESEVSEKYTHFLLDAGDFVVASSGVTWGKIAEVEDCHLPLCLNTSMIRFRPNSTEIQRGYLRAFVEMGSFRTQINKLITGSAQPNFGPSHLKQVNIPVPSRALQSLFERRVGEINLGRKRQIEALKKDEKLFTSLQHRAFRSEL